MAKRRISKRKTKTSPKVKETVMTKITAVAADAQVHDPAAETSTDVTKLSNGSPITTGSPVADLTNSSGSRSTKIAEFTLFPRFPLEIRNMIWQLSMEEGRVVQLQRNDTPVPPEFYFSNTPPPAQLHVCRESRQQALKIYELAFTFPAAPSLIYVNFAVDTIYIASVQEFPFLWIKFNDGHPVPGEDFTKIQYFVTTLECWNWKPYIDIKDLKKLTIITRSSKQPAMRKGSLRLTEEGPCPEWMTSTRRPSDYDMAIGSLEVGTRGPKD